MTATPPSTERPEHEVEYLRRTPLRKSRGSFRPPGEENVQYVHRQPFFRPWYRRFLAAIVAFVVVVAVSGGAFILSQRRVTTTVALDDVVTRFKAQKLAEPKKVSKVPGMISAGPSTLTDTKAPPPTEKVAAVGGVEAVAEPYALPAQGVYAYRTTGGEEISMFGAAHEYPSRTYGTVRYLGGCRWEMRNDVIEEHVDIREFCSDAGLLHQNVQRREITFFGQKEGGGGRFDPPMLIHSTKEKRGTSNERRDASTDGTISDTKRTYLGVETIAIEGKKIEAIHVLITAKLSGRSRGTSQDDLWVEPTTGLTLRWARKVDTYAKAFGTDVHYVENATFDLESLTPQS